jgi:chlorophyllide a hydrolase
VDAKLKQPDATATISGAGTFASSAEQLIVRYWLVATLCGILVLWDWVTSWNVPLTLANRPLFLYLLVTFALSQLLYALVARYDGRALHLGATALFALGNGIAETLAFGVVYRVGELFTAWIVGLVAPSAASFAGFLGGLILFIVYGGLIHARFWLLVLPPHLDDSPRSKAIRRWRPLAEIGLVVGWSLCFWLTRDIWTVIFFHVLVDIGLMLKVRPPIFGARA